MLRFDGTSSPGLSLVDNTHSQPRTLWLTPFFLLQAREVQISQPQASRLRPSLRLVVRRPRSRCPIRCRVIRPDRT